VAIGRNAQAKKDGGVAIGANSLNENVYATAIGYNAKSGSYATAIGCGAQATGYCGMSIGTNCSNTTDYSTSVGYSAQ
jgi:hypothetical protein